MHSLALYASIRRLFKSASTFSPIFRVVFSSKEKEQFWQIRDSSENSCSFILSRESPTTANKLRTAVSPTYFPYFEYVHVAPPPVIILLLRRMYSCLLVRVRIRKVLSSTDGVYVNDLLKTVKTV